MAIYYVSQQHGDNSNDGLSAATAKATLAGLQAVMSNVGDSCWIAPGVYRERYAFQADDQTITADPLCLHFPNDSAGQVRITGCNVNEMPTSGVVINCSGRTGSKVLGHSIDFPIEVDGSSDSYAVSYAEICFVRSVSFYGVGYCTASHSLLSGQMYSCVNTSCVNCLLLGGGTACWYATAGSNTATNCLAIGGTYGFRSVTGIDSVVTNCIVVGSGTRGFYGGASMTITSCFTLACGIAAGIGAADLLSVGGIHASYGAAGSNISGTPQDGSSLLFDAAALIRAFEPRVATGIFGLGAVTGAPAVDILGRVMKTPPDIGPYSEVSPLRAGTNIPQSDRGKVVNQ